jgi:signal transduction histidine kinase
MMINYTTMFRTVTSKIITKIGILVIIEIIIILSSFIILVYFESQGTFLGNSINIAGKNRYLTANIQLATEEYRSGSSEVAQLRTAIDILDSNIRALKEGGPYLTLELMPLPPQFQTYWDEINQNWQKYKTAIVEEIISPMQATEETSEAEQISTTSELKAMSLAVIRPSDNLVTKLGEFAKINTQNLMLLQTVLGIFNITVLAAILYLIVKMLKPISALTKATAEIKNGNIDVFVRHAGRDELSDLSQSFNSMVESIKNYRRNQDQLTNELEKINEDLKRKEKLKDEFINVASHELKSPIQPILGLASLALKGKVKHEEGWEVVLRQARKLERLANDILDVTRIESGNLSCKMDKVRINDIILDVVASTRLSPSLSERVTLHTKLDIPVEIMADRLRVTQLLCNIIGNAIKFTQSGKITIETYVHQKENMIEVRIVDTGTGIAHDILPHLFEKFSTKKNSGDDSHSGTGLGLFISKAIVLAHGGQISASNNIASGTTFTILLPIDGNKIDRNEY